MIVLDTHAWLWWAAAPEKLSARARAAIEATPQRGVCAISAWEIAMLVEKRRLRLDRDVLAWLLQALGEDGMVLLPLTPEISVGAAGLGRGFPGDPADRMILATARHFDAPLVTKDARLRSFPDLPAIW